jgi:hypothetical protein
MKKYNRRLAACKAISGVRSSGSPRGRDEGQSAGQYRHSHPPTNLREFRRQTDRNLLIGGWVILFVIGGGLVGLLFGAGQALSAVLCMAGLLTIFGGAYWLVVRSQDIANTV